MPSTYSTDLRIELIATGEQSGTWGTTTNTNLGTLIEDAISATASVSVTTANQALTALNGAADQARCAYIVLTTTTTANFNVYVPPTAQKLYAVYNNSSYIATVYCSATLGGTTAPVGATGVSIPAGKKVLLRSDGTNITEQINHVVGSISTGGGLTVDDGATIGASATVRGDLTTRGSLTANENVYFYGSAQLGATTAKTLTQSSAINLTDNTFTLAAASFSNGMAVMLSSSGSMPETTGPTQLSTTALYYVRDTSATSYFAGTGYINDGTGAGSTTPGTVLTITSVLAGAIGVGTVISGTGVTAGTSVSSLGTGVYNLSGSAQYVASTTITGTYSGSQTFKLATSFGGSAIDITATGSGTLTLTPLSTANTPPAGASNTALATTEFVANSAINNRVLQAVKAATTKNITLSGTQTIDGVALSAGDRVLVKNQFASTPQSITFSAASAQSASFTNASPTVITVAAAPDSGTPVKFSGTLPTGISSGTTYYVVKLTSTTLNISTSSTLTPLVGVTSTGSGVTMTAQNTLYSKITVGTGSAPAADSQVMFAITSGALPTGLTDTQIYYVVDRTSTTFSVAYMQDGPAIELSVAPSGAQTVGNVPAITNGIYTVDASTWSRSSDADNSAEVAAAQVAVTAGTTNGGKQFVTNFKSTDAWGGVTMQWDEVINGPANANTLGGIRVTVSGTTLNLFTY